MNMTLEKKYIPLAAYFSESKNQTITLEFTEIEKIIGRNLPNTAYLNYSWWKKTKAPAKHFQAWVDAGYFVQHVEPNRYVIFERRDPLKERQAIESAEDVLLIRPALHGDARFLAELQKKLGRESNFSIDGQEEQKTSTKQWRKQLIEWNQSGHSVILLAILNGQQVGYMMIEGNDSKRMTHRAKVQLAIQLDAQGKEIESALLQKAEEWAGEKSIKRFEVSVLEADVQTREFFEKNKYVSEGVRKESILIQNNFHNEIYMAKMLGRE